MHSETLIVGNLGRDPELRYLDTGTAVCNFSVASNYGEEVTWYRVTAWEAQAYLCAKYLKVGSLVMVKGRLIPDKDGNPRTWQGSDGKTYASFEIRLGHVTFLTKPETASQPVTMPPQMAVTQFQPDDEIPF